VTGDRDPAEDVAGVMNPVFDQDEFPVV